VHFFKSSPKALAAVHVHRKEGKCLREQYPIRATVQKFNLRIDFPKNRTESMKMG